jgi:hypothetical protein
MLIATPVARADITLELTATTPENAPGGYLPETEVAFQASLTSDWPSLLEIRLVELDFQASSPGLSFLGDWEWDTSTLISDSQYAKFPAYPEPSIAYTGVNPVTGFILELPEMGAGSLVVGTGTVRLPAEMGICNVDALSGNHAITFFTDPPPAPQPGGLTGEVLPLVVIPEPGMLALLGLGAATMLASSRKRARIPRWQEAASGTGPSDGRGGDDHTFAEP